MMIIFNITNKKVRNLPILTSHPINTAQTSKSKEENQVGKESAMSYPTVYSLKAISHPVTFNKATSETVTSYLQSHHQLRSEKESQTFFSTNQNTTNKVSTNYQSFKVEYPCNWSQMTTFPSLLIRTDLYFVKPQVNRSGSC